MGGSGRASAIGEVASATGQGTLRDAEWQERWSDDSEALQKALLEVGGDDLAQALRTYCEERRAIAAYPALSARVGHLEALLRGQFALIGCHHTDDDNPYRQLEKQLSDRVAAPTTKPEDRNSAAQGILDEVA